MAKMDYHVHSIHSYDGKQTIEEMCQSMISQGVEEVCLTEHVDIGYPDPECQGIPDWELWSREIRYLQQKYPQIRIKKGIEMADHPAYRKTIKEYVNSLTFDFVLLSLHLVENVDPYNAKVFFQQGNRNECYTKYLLAVDEAVHNYEMYDSVAHIGYIGRYAPWDNEEKPVKYQDAPDIVDDILKHLIENDKCLEINTKGFVDCLIPHDSIIKRYIELGGNTFTFGSDAHHIEENYHLIEQAKEHVKALGGKYQAGFTNRKKKIEIL